MTYWAVFDPNWGEPVPIPETIRETEDAAKTAALHLPSLDLYSRGLWDRLQSHGFTVEQVTLAECLGFPNEVENLIDIARVYFDDGAPATAADRLRQAADHLTQLAEKKWESLL